MLESRKVCLIIVQIMFIQFAILDREVRKAGGFFTRQNTGMGFLAYAVDFSGNVALAVLCVLWYTCVRR